MSDFFRNELRSRYVGRSNSWTYRGARADYRGGCYAYVSLTPDTSVRRSVRYSSLCWATWLPGYPSTRLPDYLATCSHSSFSLHVSVHYRVAAVFSFHHGSLSLSRGRRRKYERPEERSASLIVALYSTRKSRFKRKTNAFPHSFPR